MKVPIPLTSILNLEKINEIHIHIYPHSDNCTAKIIFKEGNTRVIQGFETGDYYELIKQMNKFLESL